jgi:hypothetical protein
MVLTSDKLRIAFKIKYQLLLPQKFGSKLNLVAIQLDEMEFKQRLYFEAGAIEVWICNEQGQITFSNDRGELAQSLLVPDFPMLFVLPTITVNCKMPLCRWG